MRSTEPLVGTAVLASLALLAGCASGNNPAASDQPHIPRIVSEGSRAQEYTSITQLADKASAIILGKPVGEQFVRPMPSRRAAPGVAGTPYVRIQVIKVLSGKVSGKTIDVVSPGTDEVTGKAATAQGGPYVMFLAPAMYQKNSPAGGYAIVGGPAGLYATLDSSSTSFTKVDRESPSLPKQLSTTRDIPIITKSEGQLLAEGP
ncbi:hypothetical protein BJ986_001343 [Phycicoccus badiiscoriae]|uniref:Lipoprotein n=1 Tax=Pedococcus badiiscoriae TaxID=642776 RepID=A0A852WN90_9MICO|nr:hypothetical protein [Pedococcus badiiscoriae]NYG06856.1 hypothetical protein [Pedococcus badiiscoriae]